jgi:hypothetical protein
VIICDLAPGCLSVLTSATLPIAASPLAFLLLLIQPIALLLVASAYPFPNSRSLAPSFIQFPYHTGFSDLPRYESTQPKYTQLALFTHTHTHTHTHTPSSMTKLLKNRNFICFVNHLIPNIEISPLSHHKYIC